MSLSITKLAPISIETRLHGLKKTSEKYATKGIQYDPRDLSKNALFAFSLFERLMIPLLNVQRIHYILYDFPIPEEYVPLVSLADILEKAMLVPGSVIFVITCLNNGTCLHANLVVVNKPKKHVDVFDPIGKSTNSEFGEERKLQERILRAFCCNAHFQFYGETMDAGIQCGDINNSKKREGGGFCRIWVWLAAQLCAEFPNKTLRAIVDEMTEFADSGMSVNVCRGFLAETRECAFKMMRNRNARFSKLYLDLRDAPVQTGKSKSVYYLSEKLAMEYLRDIYCRIIQPRK